MCLPLTLITLSQRARISYARQLLANLRRPEIGTTTRRRGSSARIELSCSKRILLELLEYGVHAELVTQQACQCRLADSNDPLDHDVSHTPLYRGGYLPRHRPK
jgi:hypothetical protein